MITNAAAPDKMQVHQLCVERVLQRISELESQLADLTESAANETKSTAGDKYETARAMLHIEQDQVRRQLAEARAQLAALRLIDPAKGNALAAPGSLVELNSGWFYLSTSLGKVALEHQQIIAISMQSPLGEKLRGLAAGSELVMNGKALRLLRVL